MFNAGTMSSTRKSSDSHAHVVGGIHKGVYESRKLPGLFQTMKGALKRPTPLSNPARIPKSIVLTAHKNGMHASAAGKLEL